jgi:hypothetical protein
MATPKEFTRLKADDPLVEELATGNHEWWNTLVKRAHKDPDLNIQVRGKYLSVYCRMGNLLKIEYKNKQVVCSLHYKYLIGDRRREYVDVTPSGKDLAVSVLSCDLVTSILDKENFKQIKSNIAALAGEEKCIQSKLVNHNRRTLLDAEIAFNESGAMIDAEEDKPSGGNKTRIDLVNFDKKCKSLVFIELKQVFDERLYSNSKGFKEVNDQIAKYIAFAKKHEGKLIEAYNDVIAVKKKLQLLPSDSVLWSAKIERIELKPILAVAAYKQVIIDAMKALVKENLKEDNLAGLYIFGETVDLNLSGDKSKNKELFI